MPQCRIAQYGRLGFRRQFCTHRVQPIADTSADGGAFVHGIQCWRSTSSKVSAVPSFCQHFCGAFRVSIGFGFLSGWCSGVASLLP